MTKSVLTGSVVTLIRLNPPPQSHSSRPLHLPDFLSPPPSKSLHALALIYYFFFHRTLLWIMRHNLDLNPHIILTQPLHANCRPNRPVIRYPLLETRYHCRKRLVVKW